MSSLVQQAFEEDQSRSREIWASELLGSMIQDEQYVGEVYSLGFDSALVSIHDRFRQDVGGIPSLSFLIATRLHPRQPIDHTKEDSSIILLRVLDAAPLPNDSEAARVRVESAQRAAGEEGRHWDHPEIMDASTAHLLSFAGVRCRVLGTFYLEETSGDAPGPSLRLQFGSDISNYYPNRGLKVYKPRGDALRRIVNYRDPRRVDIAGTGVQVGVVRYASSDRPFQGTNDVVVEIVPENFLAQKSAFFGMSRTGKSNTTKVVARSVFDLRFAAATPRRIGQLIFDYNGEYANENVQDAEGANPTAIKNIWRVHRGGRADDVLTFGSILHPNDLGRRLMLVNFFADGNLQTGKEIVDTHIASETSQYAIEFRGFAFGATPSREDYDTDDAFRSALTRHNRRILVYRTLLAYAGYQVPAGLRPQMARLFGEPLRNALADVAGNANSPYANDYAQAALTFARPMATWDQLTTAVVALARFVVDARSTYNTFNTTYVNSPRNATGEAWADAGLKALLGMFSNAGGRRLVARATPMHTPDIDDDYRAEIYRALVEGRLVIVDQSGGEESINRASADRIMQYIFDQQKEAFRAGNAPPDVLVYVEEAQNLLPPGSETDTKNIWARTAKEGAKFRIGLLYATQEVSGIQRAILKNTANFFISHLNNTDETRELVKYYDFEDFESSIRRAEDQGFLRVKTLSNKFTVPVQINRFVVGA